MDENRYEKLKLIGEGATGKTYLVRDIKLGRDCVMKKINIGKEMMEEAVKRETEALLKLKHQGIPVLTDIVYEEACVSLIMEYVKGDSLKDLVIKHGAFSEREVISYGLEIAAIVEFLHEQIPPIIHGDLKPENIILGERGIALLDFGASISCGAEDDNGIIAYTKGYCPPEVLNGARPDITRDVYSLGAVLFYLATGEDPSGPRGIFPIREWDPVFSEKLEQCILDCCEADEERRCRSMKEVRARLSKGQRYHSRSCGDMLFRPIKSIILTEGKI